ncbi:MAG TPA: HEAT repeat domain-containing protein, partial [Armatimonadota bacterium]|nr:HEAT repeat domain-containing protein [Armatimonadota bacterium]
GVRTASAHALWRAGEPGWSKHVHGNDEDIRALAGLRDARAVPALARALLRARWGCAADAARGLGRFGGPRAVDALIAGLRRPEPFVVGAIAVALEALGDARAAQPLLSALARPELDDAVPAIAKALGRVGGSAAVVPLLGVLSHAKPAARAAAAEALGALRDPRARDALADLVAREEGTNYHGATPWQAGARALGALADPRAIRPLLGLAPTDVSARDALRGLGLGDWVCGLTGAPGDLVRHGGEDNPWGFDLLQSALRHWGREARLYAAEELGRRLDPQTVGELVTALGDSLEVRRAAAEALAAILQAHPSALDRQTWERVADKCRQPAVHRDGPSYSHYDDPGGWDRDRLSKTIPSHGDHCDGIGVDFPDPPEGTDF